MLDPSKLYLVEEAQTTSTTQVDVGRWASCDPGDVALSGGCHVSPVGTTFAQLEVSHADSSVDGALPDLWFCSWWVTGANASSFGASVLCLDLP